MNFKYKQSLKVLLISGIFIFAMYHLVSELSTINFKQSIGLFRSLHTGYFLAIILLGFLATLAMSLYDFVLLKNLNIKMKAKEWIPLSFTFNALNNLIGFGGVFGSGLRYYIYGQYTEKSKLFKGISLMLVSMISGLSFLCILATFKVLDTSLLVDKYWWSPFVIWISAIFLPVYLILNVVKPILKNNHFLAPSFALASIVEWVCAALLFDMTLELVGIHINFGVVIGTFVVAAILGLISMVPGGIGTFDLVILVGLQHIGAEQEKLVLAILIYRLAYYILPFLVSLAILSVKFSPVAKGFVQENEFLQSTAEYNSFIRATMKEFLPNISSFLIGILLLITSILYFINHILIVYDIIFEHNYQYYLPMLVLLISGSWMVFINIRDVMCGVKRAMLITIAGIVMVMFVAILTYGTILSIIWGVALTLLMVWRYKKQSVFIEKTKTLPQVCIRLLLFLIMFLINIWMMDNVFDYNPDTYQHFNYKYYIIGIIIVITLVELIVNFITYRMANKYLHTIGTMLDKESIRTIIQTYGGNNVSHLAFSGDKSFYSNDDKTAFIMYKKVWNRLIVMGDPIGEQGAVRGLLVKFYDQMQYAGLDIVFYQVQDTNLSMYHDYGNKFFKLGEEALISLADFTISGKKQRAFRATVNKLETEGYTFEMIEPPFSNDVLQSCNSVSELWLGDEKEMHFSVGSFDANYLHEAPLAVLKDKEGNVKGFCSVMPTYHNNTISVDLIRWDKSIDLPMMDALYLNMLLWAKEQGYDYFNMGMATLSNVGPSKNSYARERLASLVFEYISRPYSFQGLKRYKQKYKPIWESRYLVYQRKQSLMMTLLCVTVAIHHQLKTNKV